MFDFEDLSLGDEYRQDHDMRLAHIIDQLPDGAPKSEVWQAFTAETTAKINAYKARNHLLRFWFGASYTLAKLAAEEPAMFLDIVNYFQERLDALT